MFFCFVDVSLKARFLLPISEPAYYYYYCFLVSRLKKPKDSKNVKILGEYFPLAGNLRNRQIEFLPFTSHRTVLY